MAAEGSIDFFFHHNNLTLLQLRNGEGIVIYRDATYVKTIAGNFYLWKNCIMGQKLIIAGKSKWGRKVNYLLDLEALEMEEAERSLFPTMSAKQGYLIYRRGGLLGAVNENNKIQWQIDVSDISKWNNEGKLTLGHIYSLVYDQLSETLVASVFVQTVLGVDINTGTIKWVKRFPGGKNNIVLNKREIHLVSMSRNLGCVI